MYVEDKATGPRPTTYTHDLNGLIAWLETMPPQDSYNFTNTNGHCLIGQFFRAMGLKWNTDSYVNFLVHCNAWMKGVRRSLPAAEPHTYGAALDRAKRLRDTGTF